MQRSYYFLNKIHFKKCEHKTSVKCPPLVKLVEKINTVVLFEINGVLFCKFQHVVSSCRWFCQFHSIIDSHLLSNIRGSDMTILKIY